MSKKVLVVTPSVRSFPPEYFEPLSGKVDHIVIDDSNGQADRSGLKQMKNVIYVDDAFQDKYLKTNERNLVPRRNPSCKNFGLLYAWKENYDIVVLLDDDCDTRVRPDYVESINIGKEVTAACLETGSRGWVNTMMPLQGNRKRTLFPRGYPYEYRDERGGALVYGVKKVVPYFNEGLWYGTPDINGIDKLTMNIEDYTLTDESATCSPACCLANKRQRLPLSIMNVQFDVSLIPAFYQPSDYKLYDSFSVRRHDDVWSFYFLKKIMDVKGHAVTFGEPMIYHRKAGDAVKEAVNETTTNQIQPYLTRLLDEAADVLEPRETYSLNAFRLANAVQRRLRGENNVVPAVFADMINDYMRNIIDWSLLFSSVGDE